MTLNDLVIFLQNPLKVARLWNFECERVFRDRMISDNDMVVFDGFRESTCKKYFNDLGLEAVEALPRLFASFTTFSADDTPIYNEVDGLSPLRKHLTINWWNTMRQMLLWSWCFFNKQ